MTSEKIWQRSDLLGTQVITRDTGKRLGVVSELWVDIDRREVVALGLRDNILARVLPGAPQYMFLNSIRQIGDVVLVDNEDVIEDNFEPDGLSRVIRSEVITEAGELLGQARGFKFNVETGKLESLVVASVGLPQIPEQLISTYELPITEIVSSGPDRLIVFEGAEERLNQLTVGVLERLGIGAPPWERDEDEEYIMPSTPVSNQLGTGVPTRTTAYQAPPARSSRPVVEGRRWDEDDWQEEELLEARPQPVRRTLQQAQPEPVRYEEPVRYREPARYEDDYDDYEEEDNWSEATGRDKYYDDRSYDRDYDEEPETDRPEARKRYAPVVEQTAYVVEENDYDDLEADAWADDRGEEDQPYRPQKLNIPEKQKAPEYEEESY